MTSLPSPLRNQVRRNHRNIAQRQNIERRNIDRAATELRGVLGRADHRCPDPLIRRLNARAPRFQSFADRVRKSIPRSPNADFSRRVEILGNTAGKRDRIDPQTSWERVAAQKAYSTGRGRLSADGLIETVRHQLGERIRLERSPAHRQPLTRSRVRPQTRRAAVSTRSIRPKASSEMRRAPISTAVCAITFPSAQTAIFDVPPPISIFMTVARSRRDRATAPDPCAAMIVSRLSPALTATIRPASRANRSPIARALLRLAATPVRIRAPASIISGLRPAAWYCCAINSPSATASISSCIRDSTA